MWNYNLYKQLSQFNKNSLHSRFSGADFKRFFHPKTETFSVWIIHVSVTHVTTNEVFSHKNKNKLYRSKRQIIVQNKKYQYKCASGVD